jgi:hypothetical protein
VTAGDFVKAAFSRVRTRANFFTCRETATRRRARGDRNARFLHQLRHAAANRASPHRWSRVARTEVALRRSHVIPRRRIAHPPIRRNAPPRAGKFKCGFR